jgi:hypothetical protein
LHQIPLDSLLDGLRPTIQPIQAQLLPAGTEIVAEFAGDHYLVPEGRQRFAYQFLVRKRTVDLSGVEEGDAAFYCFTDQRYHFIPVGGGAAMVTHSHAAEPDSRNFQVAVSKFALLHFFELQSFELKVCAQCLGHGLWLAIAAYTLITVNQWRLCDLRADFAGGARNEKNSFGHMICGFFCDVSHLGSARLSAIDQVAALGIVRPLSYSCAKVFGGSSSSRVPQELTMQPTPLMSPTLNFVTAPSTACTRPMISWPGTLR